MLPQADAIGQVYVSPAGVPVFWNRGMGYDVNGRLCTTIGEFATDVFLGGQRFRNDGTLVVAAQDATPFFNAGLPFTQAGGAECRQVDVAPGANNPYVAGIRVGPLGGVYHTTAAIP